MAEFLFWGFLVAVAVFFVSENAQTKDGFFAPLKESFLGALLPFVDALSRLMILVYAGYLLGSRLGLIK